MDISLKSFRKNLRNTVVPALLAILLSTGVARAQDLAVTSVILEGDQHVELNPDDPILYTVNYSRSNNPNPPEGPQEFRIEVYLSTDGDPGNLNNYLLDFFNSTAAEAGSGGAPVPVFSNSRRLTSALPRNFSGTYFLIARVEVRRGPGDPDPFDDYPSVTTTGSARVTIRSVDMPQVTRVSSTNLATGGEEGEEAQAPRRTN